MLFLLHAVVLVYEGIYICAMATSLLCSWNVSALLQNYRVVVNSEVIIIIIIIIVIIIIMSL